MVSPINGVLTYHRLGKEERKHAEIPIERASLVLSDVSLTITEVYSPVYIICSIRLSFFLLYCCKIFIIFLKKEDNFSFISCFNINQAQYYDGIKLLETISRYKTRVEVSHLRPGVPVSEDPHAWWRYAVLAGLQQKKMWYVCFIFFINHVEMFLPNLFWFCYSVDMLNDISVCVAMWSFELFLSYKLVNFKKGVDFSFALPLIFLDYSFRLQSI